MKRILSSIVFTVLVLAQTAYGEILELQSIKDLDLQQIDQKTLVVFDIDNTLLRQDSMVGTHQWGDYIAERSRRKGMDEKAAKEYQHKAFAELQPFVRVVPVEAEIPVMLENLSKKRIWHFALTARSSVLQATTLQQLKTLRHDFIESFPTIKNTELLKDHLKDGVIFSGSTPKGELLKLIIDNSEQKFDRIIFVDDRLYNLESVEASFVGSPIRLQSYRYGAADSFVKRFDPLIADVQYSLFKEAHVLIAEDEAQQLRNSAVALAQKGFDFFLLQQGPLVQPLGACEKTNENLAKVVVLCSYLYDQEQFAEKVYEIYRDSFTGSLYYGQW